MNASMLAVRGHFGSRFTAFLVLKYCFCIRAWHWHSQCQAPQTIDNVALVGLHEVHLLASQWGGDDRRQARRHKRFARAQKGTPPHSLRDCHHRWQPNRYRIPVAYMHARDTCVTGGVVESRRPISETSSRFMRARDTCVTSGAWSRDRRRMASDQWLLTRP